MPTNLCACEGLSQPSSRMGRRQHVWAPVQHDDVHRPAGPPDVAQPALGLALISSALGLALVSSASGPSGHQVHAWASKRICPTDRCASPLCARACAQVLRYWSSCSTCTESLGDEPPIPKDCTFRKTALYSRVTLHSYTIFDSHQHTHTPEHKKMIGVFLLLKRLRQWADYLWL